MKKHVRIVIEGVVDLPIDQPVDEHLDSDLFDALSKSIQETLPEFHFRPLPHKPPITVSVVDLPDDPDVLVAPV